MTREEILAMEGNKLRAEVAQRIMGIKVEYPFAEGYPYYLRKDKDGKMKWDIVPDYPGDISAAWQMVEKMEAEGYGHKHLKYSQNRHEGVTWVFMQPGRGIFEASGRDIKEAICKAALLTRLDEIKRLEGE